MPIPRGAQGVPPSPWPVDVTKLTFSTTGTGDVDIYSRFGARPTAATFDCRPYLSTSNETCNHTNPAAGRWWLGVHGYAAGSYTVSFSAPNLTPISGLVSLGAGVARSLAIAVQPTSSAQSGVALSTQPAIQLKDAAGNNVGQAGVVITASHRLISSLSNPARSPPNPAAKLALEVSKLP